MAQPHRTTVNPSTVSPPVGRYTHLARVRAGELLFLAGQVAVDADGDLVGEGDVAAQTRQVYRNIGAILEDAGASFSDVAQFTVYIVGRENVGPFLAARNKIFDDLFPNGGEPPSTLLVIKGLYHEEYLLEVTAVAALP
jgi:enamine deaminase RidA (YjgF/YER057c/UK114 family)